MLKDKRFAFLRITKSIMSRLVNHGKITKNHCTNFRKVAQQHFQRTISHENEKSPFSNNTLTHLFPMHSLPPENIRNSIL